ncbi:tetratricopeptide repeat protein [Streptomyces sp. NPDC093990]|uniref:tetratricopeptide repeat protein n=1 Tax=Streptomyces sp. NPDC093990 TaxID=3155306 RepID=UPI00341D46A6
MSRLSRDKKRDHQRGATPIDVRVPLTGESATVAGTPVTAPPGEELHQTVLTHLHHLALSSGHAVHATIHDARIGYVVPLEVATDGASRFTAEPVRMTPPEPADQDRAAERGAPAPETTGARPTPAGADAEPAGNPWPPAAPAPRERPTHLLRPLDDSPLDDSPQDAEPAPTQVLRQLPAPQTPGPAQAPAPAPGTVVPPTGEFGPPPVMDATPEAVRPPLPPAGPAHAPGPWPTAGVAPAPGAPRPRPTPMPTAGFAAVVPQPLPSAAPAPRPAAPLVEPVPLLDDPGPKVTPVRGFDAVAEAVLGEGLVVDESAVLAEPVGRISEAVREGRTDAAAELAEQVVGEASRTLGAEHPDVLRVRELAAYIAYLGGDPDRAAEISLDLAEIHHRAGDAEAAYGNVQSAATAWKAVRDPLRGLALGRELITLWTDLAAGEGPAAEDPAQLESARARMPRLAERARNADR